MTFEKCGVASKSEHYQKRQRWHLFRSGQFGVLCGAGVLQGHFIGLVDQLADLKTGFAAFSQRRHAAKGIIERKLFEIKEEP